MLTSKKTVNFEDDIINLIKPINHKRKLMIKKATRNFHSGYIDLSEQRRLQKHAELEEARLKQE